MDSVSFEDTIFILNMRIKMLRDILRLNPPPELFLGKCLNELEFIDWVLSCLSGRYKGITEFDYISDTEWQFSQLLTEFTIESSPFSPSVFPETGEKIALLRNNSNARRKAFNESDMPAEMAKAEPVVSSAELSSLLESF